MSRIADLNKVIFQYRLVYISLLVGFYTALSFVASIARNSGFLSFADAYALTLNTLAVATFVGIVVVLIFDFIHQELLENAASAAEVVELTNKKFEGRRMLARPSSEITSFYINISIFLFYFVPAFFVFALLYFISAEVHNSENVLKGLESQICDIVESRNEDGTGALEQVYDPICSAELRDFEFSEGFRDLIFVEFFVALIFGTILLVVAFHRIFGRFVSVVFRGQYDAAAVSVGQVEVRKPVIKVYFDYVMNWMLFFVIMLSGAMFVSLLSNPSFRGTLQAIFF